MATIVERPEFISDVDQKPLREVVHNNDSYRCYVEGNANVGATLNFRGDGITAKGGGGLQYYMVTLSPYFDINRNTGVVTLLKDAQSIIKESGSYTFQLRIRAYENRMTDAESGGGGLWAVSYTHLTLPTKA